MTCVPKLLTYVACVYLFCFSFEVVAAIYQVNSPENRVTVLVETTEKSAPYPAGRRLYYSVLCDGQRVLDAAPLGVELDQVGDSFSTNIVITSTRTNMVDDAYVLHFGKQKLNRNHARELMLSCTNASGRRMELYVRAYDDAVAFRYRLPGAGYEVIRQEYSAFKLPAQSKGWMQPFTTSYEDYYETGVVHQAFTTGTYGYPSLFSTTNGAWVLITEAALYGEYGGSRLSYDSAHEYFDVQLAESAFESILPWQTPWRVAVVGTSLASIVESSVITHLNPPEQDASNEWVQPGRAGSDGPGGPIRIWIRSAGLNVKRTLLIFVPPWDGSIIWWMPGGTRCG